MKKFSGSFLSFLGAVPQSFLEKPAGPPNHPEHAGIATLREKPGRKDRELQPFGKVTKREPAK